MTEIYNISAGFLVTFMEVKDQKNFSMGNVFKRLSIEMGGDGNSITKNQLDNYIKKAEDGEINVDKNKLNALIKIQNNWDNISNGKDSITYSDMKKCMILLAATMNGGFTKTEIYDENSSTKNQIKDYIKNYYKLDSSKEIEPSHLKNFLANLLDENNKSLNLDSNSEQDLIDTVTNMIATSDKTSSIETEI